MADLKVLKNSKSNIKRAISKIVKYLENVKNEKDATIYDVKVRLENMNKLKDDFFQVLTNIEIMDEKVNYDGERDEIEDKIFKGLALGQQFIEENEKSTEKATKHIVKDNSQALSTIRLPELSLPDFNGDYGSWYTFKDTFNALIHNNTSLSGIQKYIYLNSCLKGPAAKLLSSLEVNASNYTVAWGLLTDRFENEKLIVNSHLDALLDLPGLTKESYVGLRNLIDDCMKHKAALEMLQQPVSTWDVLLVRILGRKLDAITRKAWESSQQSKKIPTFDELIEFLKNRCRVLETLHSKPNTSEKEKTKVVTNLSTISNQYNKKFSLCSQEHLIYKCPEFTKLEIPERKKKTIELGLCLNCLKKNHIARDCFGKKCNICNQLHNRLLHMNKIKSNEFDANKVKSNGSEVNTTSIVDDKSVVNAHCNTISHVVLSTALVKVEGKNGKLVTMRSLLDVGSDSNFITKNAYEKLGINNAERVTISIKGICMSSSKTNLQTRLKVNSTNVKFKTDLKFLIVDAITSKIPLVQINAVNLNIPKHIELADPTFDTPGEIDMLIGAEIFYDLLTEGSIKIESKGPTLRNSHLGWLVTGTINTNVESERKICHLSIQNHDNDLQDKLERFWELEETSVERFKSQSEVECETNFVRNFTRTNDGKFQVYLPLKDDATLGDSKEIAINRFYNLEKRLNKDSEIKNQYEMFMDEYIKLGHMELVNDTQNSLVNSTESNLTYYIPHHHVIKDTSSTTKLRVVFNASVKSTNGKSLNDILHVGPCIQSELLDILLRFRIHNIVIIGDIEKMYRQVWVDKRFRDLQRIVWRKSSSDVLSEYRLKTITYGTAPASFLATRVLKQLAIENKNSFPEAARVIESDFYMDDCISGGNNMAEVIQLKDEIISILESAGLNLRKFGSNSEKVLSSCLGKTDEHVLRNMTEERTLGVMWNSKLDIFKYELSFELVDQNTKRGVLAVIAKIFDPLGLISPITIRAKLFLQKLWQSKLKWDESLPENLKSEWLEIQSDLTNLNYLTIPRQVVLKDYNVVEMHGFCDASEKAYGCVIYFKTINQSGEVKVELLCAKSKVAPIKTITLPRLELCGAVLLAKLVDRIHKVINLNYDAIYYWTDSSMVLNWINTEPSRLKTFVANRVAKIQSYTNPLQWHHVKGIDNPADIVSRGATVNKLKDSVWLEGPDWLTQSYIYINAYEKPDDFENDEFKICNVAVKSEHILHLFSNFGKLKRVVAWCKRFLYNCKQKKEQKEKRVGGLQPEEINDALKTIVRMVQAECFAEEIKSLKVSKVVDSNSKLLKLNCFLDENIIRVGGRLRNAKLEPERKHPIVLPKNHLLTELIIRYEHERLLHAGPQLVLSSLRQQFWPIGGRNSVRKITRKCVLCFKHKPIACAPIMGNLPSDRVNPVRPLSIVGVDYCGPFFIKNSLLRNRIIIKAYVCVFVCFVTKAVHLELTTSLNTESFLNVLKRFIGRRGIPTKIISDNGTNFVGASNELEKIKAELLELNQSNEFRTYLADNSINWNMIPARSPHFGGLHEAAVKSAKVHLKKIISNANLTYENLATVLCQIEGILNSRPLTQLSEDPEDLNILTPGHFLINQPLMSLPERNYEAIPIPKLSMYERQQKLVQDFWRKWQRDYLHLLQERVKWNRPGSNVTVGNLVLLKEDNLPPQKWKLGRVIQLHLGEDGVARVATIQTPGGRTQRAVRNLCPLPIED